MDNLERFRVYLPQQTATIPRDGEVRINRWWVYKHGMGLLAIKWSKSDISPQCSTEQAMVTKMLETIYTSDHEPLYMPIVFMAHFDDLEPKMEL